MNVRWTFPLFFCSGLSALTYQVVWMRDFRLVFGASTAATAAVSALFMAGLGLGGWFLGRRADRHERPLVLYAHLELAIAILALLSPLLLLLARSVYLYSGGMSVMGGWGATLARLFLAAVVLGPATFLMGGTLPAAVRAITPENDGSRRGLGLLYGINTLGALTGTLLTTFLLLEFLGARFTLYSGAALNIVVGLAALWLGRRLPALPAVPAVPVAPVAPASVPPATASKTRSRNEKANPEPVITPADAPAADASDAPALRPELALATAAGVGFAFFLMEIVWYRMLAPVLGGSTYTFGLVLAVALGGIGLGGLAYPTLVRYLRPSAGLLAVTCLLEALALLVPYALGDGLAALAAQLMGMSAFGFGALVLAWSVTALIVVFPAAFVSGVQFPLLIALLGVGARNIGQQTGRAYACNTAGAIAGSLAGGFGLLPWLTAPGCWRLAGGLLTLFGLAIALTARQPVAGPSRPSRRRVAAEFGLVAALLLLIALCFTALGPTAAWRHTPIGAGRTDAFISPRNFLEWKANRRWFLHWEADGVESAIGILSDTGYSFHVNGKSDGNVIGDRGTQIMCGLVGAALHPEPRRAMVIGLGTGCTAGWLAVAPGMERVDVVELEPAVLEMARLCASANHNVVAKARAGDGVRIILNDAREVLTTIPEKYDIIASEPSNPYRAGVASLFTVEFYREVRDRLTPDGLFVSWCQAYEIDTETVFTVLTTLKSVFPFVECWATQNGDLVFVSSMKTIRPDIQTLKRRLDTDTYRQAMRIAWGVEGLEGFLSRFIANDPFIQKIVETHQGPANTDDLMRVEYDYARTVGRSTRFSMFDLLNAAQSAGAALPEWTPASADRGLIALNRAISGPVHGQQTLRTADCPPALTPRLIALEAWRTGRFDLVRQRHPNPVAGDAHRLERLALAESLADAGLDDALLLIPAFEDWWPASAALVRARFAMLRNDGETAAGHLEKALHHLREAPWEPTTTIDRGLALIDPLLKRAPQYAQRLHNALMEPFALYFIDARRRTLLLGTAMHLDAEKREKVLLRWFEPHQPWTEQILNIRIDCYRETGNPLLKKAEDDLRRLLAGERQTVEASLAPKDAPAATKTPLPSLPIGTGASGHSAAAADPTLLPAPPVPPAPSLDFIPMPEPTPPLSPTSTPSPLASILSESAEIPELPPIPEIPSDATAPETPAAPESAPESVPAPEPTETVSAPEETPPATPAIPEIPAP